VTWLDRGLLGGRQGGSWGTPHVEQVHKRALEIILQASNFKSVSAIADAECADTGLIDF